MSALIRNIKPAFYSTQSFLVCIYIYTLLIKINKTMSVITNIKFSQKRKHSQKTVCRGNNSADAKALGCHSNFNVGNSFMEKGGGLSIQ